MLEQRELRQMATKVRDFKDFRKFPGKIKHGIYKFHTLYSRDSSDRIRQWTIFVRLIKKDSLLDEYEQNWDSDDEDMVKIKDKHLDSHYEISEKCVAQIWTEQGLTIGKISRPPPTIITEGSAGLKGKANERNTLTQALIKARSQYEKKISNGYVRDKEVKKKEGDRYYAMAAHKYNDNIEKIEFPLYSQRKLDGVRCITRLHNNLVEMYSRDLNDWPGYGYIADVLLPAFKANSGLYLDGELYLHGKRLQEITGVARHSEGKKDFELEYHIFDCFIADEDGLEQPYVDRKELLDELFKNELTKAKYLKQVATVKVNNQKELDALYKSYIKDGYEGQMIRFPDAPYETSRNREMRSYGLLKRKKKFDSEFRIVDYTAGTQGRAKGTIIWILEVSPDGKTFKAHPKDMTMAKMKELYNNVKKNPKKFIGKMATIEYEDLSKDKVPLRPKFVIIRDYE